MRWRWLVVAVLVLVAVGVAGLLLGRPAGRLEAVPANQAPAPPVPTPDGRASPAPTPSPSASASPSSSADEVAAAPLGTADCTGSDRLVVSSGEVEAALGHRYLVLGVTNCTDEAFDLPERPDLRVRDASGAPLGTTFSPDEHHPTTATELAPGDSAYLQLHWLVAPLASQPTAGHELVFRLRPTLTATLRTQLDVDGLTEVDVHDWAPTISEAVAQ